MSKTDQLAVVGMGDLQTMAKSIAASKMFGVATEDQAMALMLLCQAEGIHPVMALRRYHIIEGKPAYRADALQGEFEREGAIIWHCRDDEECSATFFKSKRALHERAVDTSGGDLKSGISRARERYQLLKDNKDAASLAYPDEITIIRTLKDAIEKKVAMSWNVEKGEYRMKKNWKQSPRQMLHARCLTEGVRAINPGLVAGIYTEDEVRDTIEAEIIEREERPTASPAQVAERRVKQATANATGENLSPTIVEGGAEPGNEYGPTVITQDNYGELKSHIGQATGSLLGSKIKDIHPNVVKWLYEKWRNGLTPSASDQDMRLKAAVEFAYVAQVEKDRRAGDAADVIMDAPKVVHPTPESIAACKDLRERIEDLVLTEPQAIEYLKKGGLFAAGWTQLEHAPQNILLYLSQPDGWATFKKIVENEVKPGGITGKPVQKKKARGKKKKARGKK